MKKHILQSALITLTLFTTLLIVNNIQAEESFSNLQVGNPTNTPVPSLIPSAVPVLTSTPSLDGSVIHIIAEGQTLWNIAETYGVTLEELRELNNLREDAILSLGDEVIVKPSFTPTSTPIGEPSPTLPPRFTHTPSPVGFRATEVILIITTDTPTATSLVEPHFQTRAKNPTIIILAVIISGGTLFVALILSMRRQE